MEWTKLHTGLIVNRVPDKEILAIAKYQLLWAELEHEPDTATALRYMTANQLALARQYHADIMADVCADIHSANRKRNTRRKNYIKNKENSQNVAATGVATVVATGVATVPEQIRLDKNIYLDKSKYTADLAAGKALLKPKKLNDLQKFSNAVIENFEQNVQTPDQKRIWFRRNCRCLTDILNYCGKNIPLALGTIEACAARLQKANLSGGYEAVCRNLPEYMGQAQKEEMEVKYASYAETTRATSNSVK